MSLYQEGFTQNRELSWLRYNERVLQEALDESVPLFERLKYIEIFDSNLEEFFQVRVGSLIGEGKLGDDSIDSKSGMTANEQLDAVQSFARHLIYKRDSVFKEVDEKLKNAGLVRLDIDSLSRDEALVVNNYFIKTIKNRIKTKLITSAADFNTIDENKSYMICRLLTENESKFGIIDISSNLEKVFVLNHSFNESASMRYILVRDIIKHNAAKLFFPFRVMEVHEMDIARNADISMESNFDPLSNMKEVVKKRKISSPDKLIVDGEPSELLREFLLENLFLNEDQLYMTNIISISYAYELEALLSKDLKDRLCFKQHEPFNQLKLGYGSMFDRVIKRDMLSCYPYNSMDPFLELLREASRDSRVSEIRLTVYRLASHPKIIEYLADAAKYGKKVSVLIELRARFDEENNIDWAEKLISSGCKVYYGNEKYKVHCKICQIVMGDSDNNKRYITQLSTGNFNEKTAKLYTDFSLITYNQRIGKSVDGMWNDIINQKVSTYDFILTSPKNMQDSIIHLIRREAKKGKDGRIFIKINSLTDEKIIEELMEASCSGCKIRMIVRGICCLLPGIEMCTENIEIVNVVGRFLEHSRVYIFGEGEDELIFISSADLMTRNMSKRIELACPIFDSKNKEKIRKIMYYNFFDNVKGRKLNSNGEYEKKDVTGNKIDSQNILMNITEF